MKNIILIVLLLAASLGVAAQKNHRCFHLGFHTGFDVGAAVPWPLSKAIGNGDKMDAVPHISPSVGLYAEQKFNRRWSVAAEATYKTVAIDAGIITLNSGQRFRDDDGLDVLFFGRASTSMSFTMLEVPLLLKYRLTDRSRVFLAGYYSRILNGKFEATALDGRLENPNDPDDIVIVKPEDPLNQDFSDNLDNWDAGWQVGYERLLLKRFTLAGRLSMGVKDIFKRGENYLDYSMWHMRGTLTLSYRFF